MSHIAETKPGITFLEANPLYLSLRNPETSDFKKQILLGRIDDTWMMNSLMDEDGSLIASLPETLFRIAVESGIVGHEFEIRRRYPNGSERSFPRRIIAIGDIDRAAEAYQRYLQKQPLQKSA